MRAPSRGRPAAEDAVRFAHNLGVVVVFAAGNSAADINGSSPQNLPEVIVVSATDPADQLTFFSNYGFIDVGAPGGGVNSAPPTVEPFSNILSLKSSVCCAGSANIVGTNYIRFAGTSMAAPYVTAAVAVLCSRGIKDRDEILAALQEIGDYEESFTRLKCPAAH